MSENDFVRQTQSAQDWLDGLLKVWTDGERESDEIVSHWTESFKSLTASTREGASAALKAAAESRAGYAGDVRPARGRTWPRWMRSTRSSPRCSRRRQNGYFSGADQIRLQELIDTREAIECQVPPRPRRTRTASTPSARSWKQRSPGRRRAASGDADVTVHTRTPWSPRRQGRRRRTRRSTRSTTRSTRSSSSSRTAPSGRSAMEDTQRGTGREPPQCRAWNTPRCSADVVPQVWAQADIQQAASDVDALTREAARVQRGGRSEKPALLEDLNAITAAMDEGAMTEYIAMLTQLQSLLDQGMTEDEIQAMFPEIDFTTALEQIASIQAFLNNRELELPGLTEMFGEALPEEVLTIATDLDMTGAQERRGHIRRRPRRDYDGRHHCQAEGRTRTRSACSRRWTRSSPSIRRLQKARTPLLTPEGIVALVSPHAEATTGADVSGLDASKTSPPRCAAYRGARQRRADISALETRRDHRLHFRLSGSSSGVDTSGLTPDGLTAFVLAYQEANGGALTTALTPDGITAMVAKYLEAEDVDISALSPDQVEAIVSAFAEATGCDKSHAASGLHGLYRKIRRHQRPKAHAQRQRGHLRLRPHGLPQIHRGKPGRGAGHCQAGRGVRRTQKRRCWIRRQSSGRMGSRSPWKPCLPNCSPPTKWRYWTKTARCMCSSPRT